MSLLLRPHSLWRPRWRVPRLRRRTPRSQSSIFAFRKRRLPAAGHGKQHSDQRRRYGACSTVTAAPQPETAFVFSNTIDFRRPHRGAGATGAWRHPNGSRPGQEQPSSDLESAQQCAGGERRHPRKDLLDVVARGQSAFRESATTPCLTARPFIIAAGRASPPPLVRCSEALRPASDSDACRSPSQG